MTEVFHDILHRKRKVSKQGRPNTAKTKQNKIHFFFFLIPLSKKFDNDTTVYQNIQQSKNRHCYNCLHYDQRLRFHLKKSQNHP